jgi:hypothetical protein
MAEVKIHNDADRTDYEFRSKRVEDAEPEVEAKADTKKTTKASARPTSTAKEK